MIVLFFIFLLARSSFIRLCAKDLELLYEWSNEQACNQREQINGVLQDYNINNMWREVFFLAQMGHLSNSLTIFQEQTDGSQYEFDSTLCNTEAGDGYKYLKRGAGIMILGKCDYYNFGRAIGHEGNFMEDYELVARRSVAMVASCWKWDQLGMNDIADEVYDHPNQDIYDIFDKTTRLLTDGDGATADEIAEGHYWLERVFTFLFDDCTPPSEQRRSGGIVKCEDPTNIFCGLSCPADGYEGECVQF